MNIRELLWLLLPQSLLGCLAQLGLPQQWLHWDTIKMNRSTLWIHFPHPAQPACRNLTHALGTVWQGAGFGRKASFKCLHPLPSCTFIYATLPLPTASSLQLHHTCGPTPLTGSQNWPGLKQCQAQSELSPLASSWQGIYFERISHLNLQLVQWPDTSELLRYSKFTRPSPQKFEAELVSS